MAAQAKTKFKRLSIEKCGECGADSARLFCGRCQQQYYCSDECQLEHWTAHKPDCVPVEEQDRRKKLGEMMVKAGGDGQLRLVQQLVEGRGVDVNFVNAEWYTALYLASGRNHVQVVDWLVAAGGLPINRWTSPRSILGTLQNAANRREWRRRPRRSLSA